MIEFTAWPKTPRLFRDMTITEKIDGTNAAVHVVETSYWSDGVLDEMPMLEHGASYVRTEDKRAFWVRAQSRKRLITPQEDNYGFARYVEANALGLATTLGTGVHFGEWWGSGIQRGYGLTGGEKRFSLFNVNRYTDLVAHSTVPGLGVVPVLFQGPFDSYTVKWALKLLEVSGSHAAPGFQRPEGVVVFHEASRSVYKALIENDDQSKGDG